MGMVKPLGREGQGGSTGGSEQPPPALDGPAAAQQLFALHAAHFVVVIPGQLRASTDPPGERRTRLKGRGHSRGQEQPELPLPALPSDLTGAVQLPPGQG